MTTPPPPVTDPRQFLSMSGQQLDDLFRNSPAGAIPSGSAEGEAIVGPGTEITALVARFIHFFAWKGKYFEPDPNDPGRAWLKNRLLPLGEHAIAAHVLKGTSWLDGKETIVLDYSHSSIVAQWIRDEIRQLSPNLYLGIVYWGKEQATAHRLIHFSLKF